VLCHTGQPREALSEPRIDGDVSHGSERCGTHDRSDTLFLAVPDVPLRAGSSTVVQCCRSTHDLLPCHSRQELTVVGSIGGILCLSPPAGSASILGLISLHCMGYHHAVGGTVHPFLECCINSSITPPIRAVSRQIPIETTAAYPTGGKTANGRNDLSTAFYASTRTHVAQPFWMVREGTP
jgi:hypothetical protein